MYYPPHLFSEMMGKNIKDAHRDLLKKCASTQEFAFKIQEAIIQNFHTAQILYDIVPPEVQTACKAFIQQYSEFKEKGEEGTLFSTLGKTIDVYLKKQEAKITKFYSHPPFKENMQKFRKKQKHY